MLVVQRVFRAKRTNLHEKYDYPIAEDCGFGNAERMRRSFQRLLGRPPGAFRQQGEPAADH